MLPAEVGFAGENRRHDTAAHVFRPAARVSTSLPIRDDEATHQRGHLGVVHVGHHQELDRGATFHKLQTLELQHRLATDLTT